MMVIPAHRPAPKPEKIFIPRRWRRPIFVPRIYRLIVP